MVIGRTRPIRWRHEKSHVSGTGDYWCGSIGGIPLADIHHNTLGDDYRVYPHRLYQELGATLEKPSPEMGAWLTLEAAKEFVRKDFWSLYTGLQSKLILE